jgi:hypothetical protein
MAMLYIRPTTYAVHSGAQGSIYFNSFTLYLLPIIFITTLVLYWYYHDRDYISTYILYS